MKTAALLVAILAAGPQITPPRDNQSAPPVETAIIRGRVTALDGGHPIGLATITARAAELSEPRSISTSPDGRYELRGLPAGRYTLSVSRNGYLTLGYGQTRPLEQGRPLQLATGQTVDDVDFAVPRASAISGRITDERGEPIVGASVLALLSSAQVGSAGTNELGEYRIPSLSPGSYVVRSEARGWWWPSNQPGRSLGFPVTYYPDSLTADGAARISPRAGEEVPNIDLVLLPARAATISGTMADSRGRPLSTALVSLMQSVNGGLRIGVPPGALPHDGRFTIPNVMPGSYTLIVRGTADGVPPSDAEAALIPVTVNGVDFDVAVTTSTGWSVSGRVIADSAATAPMPRAGIVARAVQLTRDDAPMFAGSERLGFAPMKDDGTFMVGGVYGRARLIVNVPAGWTVKAIRHEGRDVSGVPIETKNGETLSGVEVVLTNRLTQITGSVADGKGSPLTAGTAIVFSEDRERWFDPLGLMRPGSTEFIRAARPDQSGSFQMKGLPPGEYLAVALDYVPDRLWFDPSFLESIRTYAQRVTLADGESKTLALTLVSP